MRRIALLMLLVVGCASLRDPVIPPWLNQPTVTLYRLRGYPSDQKGRADQGFQGLEIVEERTVSAENAAAIVEAIREAWLRRQALLRNDENDGEVGAGVIACISGEVGVRLSSRGQSRDLLLHCDVRLEPLGLTGPGEHIQFTQEESRLFRSALNRVWP